MARAGKAITSNKVVTPLRQAAWRSPRRWRPYAPTWTSTPPTAQPE